MSRRAPILLLGVAVLSSGVLLASLASHLTFLGDGWELLIRRQDWSADAFLSPFHGHPLLGPAAVYKLLVAVFGMDSALPFYAVSISLFLLSAVLLFVLLRPRVGDWPALAAAVLILFLGAASEDLLWEFQMGYFGSVAAGLGMLIAFDREDRTGDLLAGILLVLSLAFSSVGIPFAAGALAHLVLSRRPRAGRAAFILLPIALYLAWWIGWDAGGETSVTSRNVEELPRYVFDAAAAGIASLLGRDPLAADGRPPLFAQLALIAFGFLAAVKVFRERKISRGLAVALTMAVAFWVLSGLARDLSRYPTASRYQYPSAVFLLLVAAELLRGVRVPRWALLGTAAVTAVAVAGGISLLQRDYDNFWRPTSDSVRTTLAAVDVVGPSAPPGARVQFPPESTLAMQTYLDVRARDGSPAFTLSELKTRPPFERELADRAIVELLGIGLQATRRGDRGDACGKRLGNLDPKSSLRLSPGSFSVVNPSASPASIRLGRFAPGAPVALGEVPPRATRRFSIPADEASVPWRATAEGDGTLRLCRTREGPAG